MFRITMAATLCIAALASPASAQAVNDDVRCFLLSNAFAKKATDPEARAMASASLAFFLGRIDGRMPAPAMGDLIRRVGASIDPKAAGPQMTACAARLTHAEQAIQASVKPK
jgi:hypothetical protein